MSHLKETFKILPPDIINRTYFILFSSVVVFFIEILGVGVFIPLLKILTNPEFFNDNPDFSKIILFFSFIDFDHPNLDPKNILKVKMITGGCILIILVFFIKFLILTFYTYCLLNYRARVQSYLSSELLKKYANVSLDYYFFKNSSEILRNITSDVSHYSTTLMSVLIIIAEIPIFLGISVLLIFQQPYSSLVTLSLFSFLIFLLYSLVKKKLFFYGEERVKYEADRINFINQIIEGFKDIKILGRSKNILKKFNYSNKKAFDLSVYTGFITASQRFFLEFFLVVCLSVIIILMIPSVKNFSDIIFTIGLFAVAMFRMLPSFSKVLLNLNNIRSSRVSFLKVFSDIKNVKSELEKVTEKKLKFENEIVIQNLSFKYSDRVTKVIKKINLSIKKGEMIGLIGESGSGKSTLVELILGFLKPNTGKIIVDHQDIFMNLREWRNQIGYVTQRVFLTDDTIEKNIAFALDDQDIKRDRVEECVKQAQLGDFISTLSEGINTKIGERGIQLSGGQKQRISIARAIYDNPEVLVLDEATSSLDKDTEKQILEIIKNFKNNKTIILISHDINSLKDCDKIFKITNGEIQLN
jgi:ATP-binding cassette, subfamily B, bacterial PglK